MIRYLLSRLMGMFLVMALVAVIVFVLTRAASGDPITVLLGEQATAEDIVRESLNIAADICIYTNHNVVIEKL